jgi:GNAT superfamily N-acetyltransferase
LEEAKEKPTFLFEPLGSAHDRAAFACGEPILDDYLKTQASQQAKKKIAAVFVMTPDGKAIAGFYTLSQYAILSSEIPEALSRALARYDQIPSTLIGRLARHTAHRKTGVGDLLLADALRRCLEISKQAASWAVVVEAKNESGTAFYKKWGFEAFPGHPLKLFLSTKTIEKMFA